MSANQIALALNLLLLSTLYHHFNLHIDKIYLQSANQLYAFLSLKRFLGNKERKFFINSSFIFKFQLTSLSLDVSKCEICE